MNFFCLGYISLFLYVLVENLTPCCANYGLRRRIKALAPVKQQFHVNGWGFVSTHAPEAEFVGNIPGITVIAGKDAVLRCVVDNLGDHKISWSFVERKNQLSIGTHVFKWHERISVTTSNFTSWYLHIKNVTQSDSGYYICQISTNPIKTQAGYLHVVEPPEFVTNMTNRNVTIMENSDVTLSCKANGNPPPVIKWRREDKQPFLVGNELVHEYLGEELKIIAVSRLHMAAYLCIANNEVPPAISRRIYLDIKFPPLIWIPNHLVAAPQGIDVHLECHTEAHPTSDNFWMRDDEAVVSRSSRYQPHITRTSYKTLMRLTIRDVKQEDYGSYQCVAKNPIGETSGSIKLYRLVIPSPLPPKPVTEEPRTIPTWKVITVAVTTDYKALVTDLIRSDDSNTPGKQQKYGHNQVSDADEDEGEDNSAIYVNDIPVYSLQLSMLFFMWRHFENYCR